MSESVPISINWEVQSPGGGRVRARLSKEAMGALMTACIEALVRLGELGATVQALKVTPVYNYDRNDGGLEIHQPFYYVRAVFTNPDFQADKLEIMAQISINTTRYTNREYVEPVDQFTNSLVRAIQEKVRLHAHREKEAAKVWTRLAGKPEA